MRFTPKGRGWLTLAFVCAGLAVLYVVSALLQARPVGAATAAIVVTTTVDDTSANGNCTLREAIRAANLDSAVDGCQAGSGADIIVLPSGVYAFTQAGADEDGGLTGDLDIAGDLTITGELSATTVIDAASADRVLDIHSGHVVLSDLTVRRGRIIRPESAGVFRGAGILVHSAAPTSSLELRSSAVSDNVLATYEWMEGGGIYSAAPLTISDSLISANAASQGGGIYSQAALYLEGSACRENKGMQGGGIFASGRLVVRDSLIDNNAAYPVGAFNYPSGGGIDIGNGAVAHISGSTISRNKTGSGISTAGTTWITDTLITANAGNGGGGIMTWEWLSLSASTVSDNNAYTSQTPGVGGGLFNYGTLIVSTSLISGNTAAQTGGLFNYGQATISASSILNNSSVFGFGGGVHNSDIGQITLANVTVSGNSAQGHGGGLANSAGAAMTLNNSTVTNNLTDRADISIYPGDGGGVYAGSPITLSNSLIAGNADRTGQAPDAAGTLISGGHYLIGDTAGVTLTGDPAGNLLNVAALLGPLADNGGATPTHAPLADSPAIDAASPLAPASAPGACAPADQRGAPRPLDGDGDGAAICDIGAVEVGMIVVTTTADDTSANGNCTLREAIRAANLDSAVDGCQAGSGADIIVLPSGVYAFTLTGVDEDAALTGDLDILADLTISGALSSTSVIDAALTDRVFDIHSGHVTLSGLTVRRGRINGSLFPTAQFWGGAGILVRSAAPTSSLELNSSAVVDNRLVAENEWTQGGGIYSAAPLTVSGSLISANAASEGGGIYSQAALVFDHSVSRENLAKSGAGIYSQGSLTVTGSSIHANGFYLSGPFSYASGTGIYAFGSSRISASTISGNSPGGGLTTLGQSALTTTLVIGNIAEQGGGIWSSGRLSLSDSTVMLNRAMYGRFVSVGGGILSHGTLIVSTSVISANTAQQGGGIVNTGQAALSASAILSNVALGGSDDGETLYGSGGGVYNTGQITLTNVTVSGNGAQLSGGGLASAGSSARLSLFNSTVTNNLADRTENWLLKGGDAGGVYAGSPVSITNSLIAGNATRTGQHPDAGGVFRSGGHNLIGSTAGVTLTGDPAGNLLNVAALLGPLEDHGGAALTHALLANSPAIDAASPLAPGSAAGACAPTDQRGVPRPLDGDGDGAAICDIGAVEITAAPVPLRRAYLPFIVR